MEKNSCGEKTLTSGEGHERQVRFLCRRGWLEKGGGF